MLSAAALAVAGARSTNLTVESPAFDVAEDVVAVVAEVVAVAGEAEADDALDP